MGLQRLQHNLVTEHQLVSELYYVFWLSSIVQLCSFLQWFSVNIRNIASEALEKGHSPCWVLSRDPRGAGFSSIPGKGTDPGSSRQWAAAPTLSSHSSGAGAWGWTAGSPRLGGQEALCSGGVYSWEPWGSRGEQVGGGCPWTQGRLAMLQLEEEPGPQSCAAWFRLCSHRVWAFLSLKRKIL